VKISHLGLLSPIIDPVERVVTTTALESHMARERRRASPSEASENEESGNGGEKGSDIQSLSRSPPRIGISL